LTKFSSTKEKQKDELS